MRPVLSNGMSGLPLDQQSSAFAQSQRALETKLSQMQERCEAHLQEPDLHLAKQKVLSSLHNHWDGLTVFVERPEVAMDNNTAERILRNPVVGRKNYYGSGSVWSAHLAAMMFSVLQTILLWGLNPHHWLQRLLTSLCGQWWPEPGGPQSLCALADECRAPRSAVSTAAGDGACFGWSCPRATRARSRRYVLRPALPDHVAPTSEPCLHRLLWMPQERCAPCLLA